jgi:hypothetical protein
MLQTIQLKQEDVIAALGDVFEQLNPRIESKEFQCNKVFV